MRGKADPIAQVIRRSNGTALIYWLGTSMQETYPSIGAAIDAVETSWVTVVWENPNPGEWVASRTG
jgi:hypothetical protein